MNDQQVKLITTLANRYAYIQECKERLQEANAAYNAEWNIFLKQDIEWPPERTIALIGPTVYEFQFDVDDASTPTCTVERAYVFVGEE